MTLIPYFFILDEARSTRLTHMGALVKKSEVYGMVDICINFGAFGII